MHFTEQLIENLNIGKIVVSDVGATIPGISTTEDKLQFLYEACSASVKEDLNTAKVPVAIKAAGVDADGHWTRQNLAQVIWLLAQEVADQEALFTKLKDLVQDLQKAALYMDRPLPRMDSSDDLLQVGKNELLEVAPIQFLAELGVVPQTAGVKKEGNIKGNLFYKLNKFNALREENEGFSKMLVCLQSFGATAAETSENVPQLMLEIRSLIGYFDLDPNRVAALVLDIFQDQWDNEAYLQLLPLFSHQAIRASLSFIFAHYKREGEVAPDNLYRMSVQLIKATAVTLDGLWVHLSPDDDQLKSMQSAAQQSALEAFRSRNNLNRVTDATEVRPGEFGISAQTFNLDPRELLTKELQPLWADNQKLELLRIAFEMGELDLAWRVYTGLKAIGVEPADYPPISAWMAGRVLAGISPPPGQGPKSQQEGQEVPLPTMSMEAADLLNKLGMSFSTSGELWVRLVRHWRQFLLHHHFQAEAGGTDQALLEAAVSKVCDELACRLIPGMALMTPNPFLAAELWSLLELLPYSRRFELYEDVSRLLNARGGDSMDSICLQAAADSVYRLTKRIASRMGFDKDPDKVETVASKKEKEKQVKGLSRNFAKVSHSNPIIVAEYLVSYAQNNGSHSDSLTDAMSDLSDVVLDVITYRVIRTFTVSKNRYKPDNVLTSDPLASASRFAAMAARKLSRDSKHGSGGGVELHALLQMVLNAGLKSHSEVFVILGDLVDVCAGVHVLEDVGNTELPALAGGDVLRTVKIVNQEVRLASKVAKAGMDRLASALTSKEHGAPLAVPLFVILAQNRALHVIGEDRGVGNVDGWKKPEDRIRVVSDRFDQANKLLVQYAEFLRLAIDKTTYRELMPPLADLLDPAKYGLEPEVAFLLYRPVLSRVPFPSPPAARDEEDGEIPVGDEAPMEVEQETYFGDVRWSHLVKAVEAALPQDAKRGLTKPFYLLFWRLTFSDICSANTEYDKQVKLLQRDQAELQQELDACGQARRDNIKFVENDDDRKLAQKHYTKKQEVLREYIKLLEREKSRMEDRWREGVKLFRQWKDHLLVDTVHSNTIPAFIGHCLLPRCILTPEDAMYCAAFIRRMALEDTPYFSFMLCAQMLVPTGLTLLYTMTEREADNFGIFFRELLRSIHGWWANHKELEDLLPRQGFRMDGRHYSAPPEAARHANVVQYNDFVRGVQGSISVKLVEIFKANAHTNVNLKAAVNAMLVLNKIKLVCPIFIHAAKSMLAALRPMYTRLEPPKDAHGNFMEQAMPLYNLAIKCHKDLENVVQANVKFDAGTSSTVPNVRLWTDDCYYELFDKAVWDPQWMTKPAPKPSPPAAGVQPAAQPAPAVAAAPAGQAAPAPAAAAPAGTAPAAAEQEATATRATRDGTARATTTGRGTKDALPRRDSKEGLGRDGTAARDTREPGSRDGRDAAGGRGRDSGGRAGREHNERGATVREGRDGTRAATAAGKAADDKQLAEVRAAALKKQSSVKGDAVDSTKRASPSKREEAAKAGKATANGTAAATGTKRRAPDSGPAETRGAKAAKTDAGAAPHTEAAKAAAPGAAASRPSTRKGETTTGDNPELRADAPEFKPSTKNASEATLKRPTETAEKRPSSREWASAEGSDKRPTTVQDKPSGAAADKPSEGSSKPPVHPEQPLRAATKRGRDPEPSSDAAKRQQPADVSKAVGDEQEPKRRKHKVIAWAPPDQKDTEQPTGNLQSPHRRDNQPHDDPRRTPADPLRALPAALAQVKRNQHDARARPEEDRRRTRSDVKEGGDRKHAPRDGHRTEAESRPVQRDSQRVEPEAKHAQREVERGHRAAHRDRNVLSPRDSHRHREADDGPGRGAVDRTHSTSRSDERKAAAARPAAPEEQEDGEVCMAKPDVQLSPEREVKQNGVVPVPSPQPPSPIGQDGKDYSDGKESKKSHKRGHKQKDKKERKSKDHKHKKDRKDKDKDPEKEKAKAEKKAEKAAAAAAAASTDAAAQPASSPTAADIATARPDTAAAEAAVVVPKAADTSAAPAAAAPPVARLASSISRQGNRASPSAPPGLEPKGTGGREGSDPPPASSRRPVLASSASRRARDASDTPPRAVRGERRDGSGDGHPGPGPKSSEALPPDDLRHLLRNKSNPDQSIRSERPPPERVPARRHRQDERQPTAQAPKVYPARR